MLHVRHHDWTALISAEQAIQDILNQSRPGYDTDDCDEARIENIIELLSRFLGPQMKSSSDLNNLAGYNRYSTHNDREIP